VLIAGRRHQAACSSLCRDEANDTPVVALARESQCKFLDSDLQINIFLVESNSYFFILLRNRNFRRSFEFRWLGHVGKIDMSACHPLPVSGATSR
jgi:hypothetical protein